MDSPLAARAEALGFAVDAGIDEFVQAFIEDDLQMQKQTRLSALGQSAVAPTGCCATAIGVSRTQRAATTAANRPNRASA
jgi:hypothetical protein